jgi:hypothetical protein
MVSFFPLMGTIVPSGFASASGVPVRPTRAIHAAEAGNVDRQIGWEASKANNGSDMDVPLEEVSRYGCPRRV